MSKKLKTLAQTVRLETRVDVEQAIKDLGDLQRQLETVAIEQNNKLAAITEVYAPKITKLQEEIKPIQTAVQAWCESHRDDLTNGGRTKTGVFNTGEVQWRARPPSVAVRGTDSVIENLKTLGLIRFIRTKEEVNKEAMLNEPELAGTVAGITIKTGVEDFVITPFEQKI